MKDISSRQSFFRSWYCSRDDFAPVLKNLLSGLWQECPAIYQTRHKECRLVTREISGLSYPVVLKRYCEKRFFRYLFRPSMAYREYLGFRLTANTGIPTAKVAALGEIRRFVYLREAFFVTEYLEDYRNGDEFVKGFVKSDENEALRDEFIRINLQYLAKLHAAGLVHGGFHPRNELFRVSGNGQMDVVWIDLATVAPQGKCRRFSPEKDLKMFFREFELAPEKEQFYRSFYAEELRK